MARFLRVASVVTVALLSHPQAYAQKEPVGVMTVSSGENVLGDIVYLGKKMHLDDAANLAELIARAQFLVLDKTRPIRVSWMVGEEPRDGGDPAFTYFAVLPITNRAKFLEFYADGPEVDVGNEITKFNWSKSNWFRLKEPYFLRKQGDWSYIGPSELAVTEVPIDAHKTIGGTLPSEYDIAWQLNVQRLPKWYRQAEGDAKDPIFSSLIPRAREEIAQVTVGLLVDETTRDVHLDASMVAVEGTKLSDTFDQLKNGKSRFAGFELADAAMTLNFCVDIPDHEAPSVKAFLADIRLSSFAEYPIVKNVSAEALVRDIASLLSVSASNGKIDGGIAVLLEPNSAAIVAGGYIPKPEEGEAFLEKWIKAFGYGDTTSMKAKMSTHNGIRLKTFSITLPDDAELQEHFGDQIDVTLGTNANSIYLAIGQGSTDALKTAIDNSSKRIDESCPSLKMRFSLCPIFRYYASLKKDARMAAASSEIKGLEDRDDVTLVTKPISGGIRTRLRFDEGALSVIGIAPSLFFGTP